MQLQSEDECGKEGSVAVLLQCDVNKVLTKPPFSS